MSFASRLCRREMPLWSQASRHKTVALVLIGIALLSGLGVVSLAAAVDSQSLSDIVNRRDHDAIVDAMEKQVELVTWIGGAIVSSLAAATGLLYRALERSNAQSRGDLVEGIKRREVLVEAMTQSNADVVKSNSEVTREIQDLNSEVRTLVQEVRKA